MGANAYMDAETYLNCVSGTAPACTMSQNVAVYVSLSDAFMVPGLLGEC